MSFILRNSCLFKFLKRFVCLKRLNQNQTDCNDFQVRFCCPKLNSDAKTDNKRERRTVLNRTEPDAPIFANLPIEIDELRNSFNLLKIFDHRLSSGFGLKL